MWSAMRRVASRFCLRSDRGVGICFAGAVGGTLGSLVWVEVAGTVAVAGGGRRTLGSLGRLELFSLVALLWVRV